jgi:hypothetical protein
MLSVSVYVAAEPVEEFSKIPLAVTFGQISNRLLNRLHPLGGNQVPQCIGGEITE